MRLMAKVVGYRVVIPPPERLETVLISASLLLLYVSGGVLIALGITGNPEYLANGKLQGKLTLVVVLTLNALVLHFRTFPILGCAQPVASWSRLQWLTVSGSVSLSTSTWFYCAFLGVARVWNFSVSVWFVLAVGLAIWALVFLAANAVLMLAAREVPQG